MARTGDDNATNQLVHDHLNYLMSGPSGLGQNFSGFSTYTDAYLTGQFRAPFSVPITTSPPPTWYVTPISINNIILRDVDVDGATRVIEMVFTTPQATAPFVQGDTVTAADIVATAFPGSEDADYYNGKYPRSVLQCSTTSVVLQTTTSHVWPTYVSGGNIGKNNSNEDVSTDANARVTVAGPTDRVFISSQLALDFTYTCSMASEFDIIVKIDRYRAFLDRSPGEVDYLFDFDDTVSQRIHHYTVAASGSDTAGDNIFTTVLDQPSFGYFWYIVDVYFSTYDLTDPENPVAYPGDAAPGIMTVGLRSLSAQVVKE